jgi:hypothetical protein
MVLLQVNNTNLYYNDNFSYGCVNDHNQYVFKLLKNIIENNNLNINISLCSNFFKFNNNNKTITINFNYEHTLVKEGGRGVTSDCPIINIGIDKYYIRVCKFNELINNDIIIEYSNPNIKHMNNHELFKTYVKKCVYISSCIFSDIYHIKENRQLSTLTTFINTDEPRRAKLLQNIKSRSIDHINVNNCFNIDNLKELYKNTKIIINIHQTDHHHTFEELRILPCLQCGVIAICEDSPYKELIPYHDYIIWSSYDNILNTVEEVLKNYDYYFNEIFNKKKHISLNDLHDINYNNLLQAIQNNL